MIDNEFERLSDIWKDKKYMEIHGMDFAKKTVKDEKVYFKGFLNNKLHYVTDSGFGFSFKPITGDKYLPEDKAIYFMKHIMGTIEKIKKLRNDYDTD